ncbi:MAG: hypothetical protein IPN17_05215 [Deltaproteobacteria bacterium]|nr:hypothetical protein [Deltaproteobacteria bacterium]
MAKKKIAPTLETRWGHRMPDPLPELAVDDHEAARVQRHLREGGGDPEAERALQAPSPPVTDLLLRYLALPESTDLGSAPWDQRTCDALDPAGRRLYRSMHRKVEVVRHPRSWGLFFAARALATSPEGRALVLRRFREGTPDAREQIARALTEVPERLDFVELDALSTMLDGDATPDSLRALGYGAWAAYRRDPATAFERLAPRLDAGAIDDPAGRQRAIAVLVVLSKETRPDARWGGAIRPLLRDRLLGGYAVWALDGCPLDASWVEDLLAYLHLDPRVVNVFDLQALKLLAGLADTRAVGVFLEALAKNSTALDVVLTSFERLPDERLRAAFAQWVEAREREGVPPDWPPLVRARALLAPRDAPLVHGHAIGREFTSLNG